MLDLLRKFVRVALDVAMLCCVVGSASDGQTEKHQSSESTTNPPKSDMNAARTTKGRTMAMAWHGTTMTTMAEADRRYILGGGGGGTGVAAR